MPDDFAVSVPRALASFEPVEVALILGSGLSGLADVVENQTVVPYGDIEGFPRPERDVVGHAGKLVIGTLAGEAEPGPERGEQAMKARVLRRAAHLRTGRVVDVEIGGVRAFCTQGHVVIFSAALITVAFNLNLHFRVFL